MSKRCKARNQVIAELDFIHGMTHNLREVVDEADCLKRYGKQELKILKEVQNTIVDFLKDIDEENDIK